MSRNVIRYFGTITHVAVSFQVSERRLWTVDPGRKITMSSLLPEDRKGLFKCTLMFIRLYACLLWWRFILRYSGLILKFDTACTKCVFTCKMVLNMCSCSGARDISFLMLTTMRTTVSSTTLSHMSFVSNSILISSYLFFLAHSDCWIKFLQVIRLATSWSFKQTNNV